MIPDPALPISRRRTIVMNMIGVGSINYIMAVPTFCEASCRSENVLRVWKEDGPSRSQVREIENLLIDPKFGEGAYHG